jgi:hypothetical protein
MLRVPTFLTRLMSADKWLHIALGIVWLAAAMTSYWVLMFFNVGAFLAYHTTVYALLYEVNQGIRGDGQVDIWDAVATALPGWAVWGLLELLEKQ